MVDSSLSKEWLVDRDLIEIAFDSSVRYYCIIEHEFDPYKEATMSALVDVRLTEAAVRSGAPCAHQAAVAGRRRVRTTPARRMAQPVRPGRPVGVRGPVVPQHELRASQTPPPVLELGVRLSDRGLALVLGLATVLIVAALVCIGSTALRVTSEPPVATTVAMR